MTTKTIDQIADAIIAEPEPFPDYPPRDDMQNFIHLYRPSYAKALERFLASRRRRVMVVSEVPISRRYGYYRGVRIPDLTVSYDSDWDMMIEHNGYAIDRQGGPPVFVLEIASVSTANRDETQKREDYAGLGISEYWRFDPTGGDRYEFALAGDRMADGVYRPVPIEWLDDDRCRGWSEALGLYLCWEYGELRFYDPASETYLLTHDEEAEWREWERQRANREAELRGLAEDRARQAEDELAILRARLRELGVED